MSYTYSYPRPAVTVDAMVFKGLGKDLQVLLIKRKHEPFKDMWALPGGFMDMDETLEAAVYRELKEETGIEGVPLEQFRAFSGLDRDPRGRTISVVFYGHATPEKNLKIKASDDAIMAEWHHIHQLPKLAFDHQQVLNQAMKELNL